MTLLLIRENSKHVYSLHVCMWDEHLLEAPHTSSFQDPHQHSSPACCLLNKCSKLLIFLPTHSVKSTGRSPHTLLWIPLHNTDAHTHTYSNTHAHTVHLLYFRITLWIDSIKGCFELLTGVRWWWRWWCGEAAQWTVGILWSPIDLASPGIPTSLSDIGMKRAAFFSLFFLLSFFFSSRSLILICRDELKAELPVEKFS